MRRRVPGPRAGCAGGEGAAHVRGCGGRRQPDDDDEDGEGYRLFVKDDLFACRNGASFDADVQFDGVLIIGVWVEAGVGDGKLRSMIDDLVAIIHNGDGPGIQFFEPQPELPEYEGRDWYGRQLSIPFVRFQNL